MHNAKSRLYATKWLILRCSVICVEHICNPSTAGTQARHLSSGIAVTTAPIAPVGFWTLGVVPIYEMQQTRPYATPFVKEWTTVAVVRDPWTRAISSFQDQIKRKHVAYSSATRDNFLTFTTRHEGYGHHRRAVGFAACPFLRTILVDVEDLEGGFGPVLRANPRLPERAFRSGWEKCTPDGNPSLLAVQGQLSNSDSRVGESKEAKARRNNAIYCNKSTADAVAKRFAKDYRMLAAQGFVYRRCDVGTAAPHR